MEGRTHGIGPGLDAVDEASREARLEQRAVLHREQVERRTTAPGRSDGVCNHIRRNG
jgi:hypothetical protein